MDSAEARHPFPTNVTPSDSTHLIVSMSHIDLTPAQHAERVIARTVAAWKIPPVSLRAAARRAPHGYVPVRVMRRMRAAAVAVGNRPAFAHSW
jgi:hypothetical protein